MAKTMKLGQTIKVTPSDTKDVDALKVKGAGELATLIPMDGAEFERGYIDMMIKGHTDAIAMIDDKLLKTAKNEALKKHLTETRGHAWTRSDALGASQAIEREYVNNSDANL